MKKIIAIIALSLVLTGCSSSTKITSKVTDPDEVSVTIDGIKITKQSIYETLLSSYGANTVIDNALQIIAKSEITDETAIQSKIDSTLENYATTLGGEEALLTYAQSSGYESIDAFVDNVLRSSLMQTMLIQKYITENFETLASTYGYSYIKYFSVDSEETALSIIGSINDENTFETVALQYTETEPAELLSYTEAATSAIDANITSLALGFTKEGVYSVPVLLTDGTYAVIKVSNVDRESFRTAIEDNLLTISAVTTEAETFYFKKYNFEVFEKGLSNDIKAINSDYLN